MCTSQHPEQADAARWEATRLTLAALDRETWNALRTAVAYCDELRRIDAQNGHLMPGNEAQAAKLLDAYLDAATV